ncbi:P27 family phage terminase small subunit [Microbacterium hominis]|nr:P27 family phage terminase small subunit [Microbacterium hominis]QOC28882.1 P27 family phage terminase small subunit [Microbacterium hominis]
MASPKPFTIPSDPPERLDEEGREVWRDVVERGAIAPGVDEHTLEAYCALVVRWRDASRRIAEDGLVVDGGEKRGAIVHPALAAERQLAQQLREWAELVNRPAALRRRPGRIYDATRESIKEAGLDTKKQYAGACEAVLTLAWLIDEAQREGLDELRKAAHPLIPNYLKGCAELKITPASVPAQAGPAPAVGAGPTAEAAPDNDIAAMRRKLGAG